MTPARLRAEIVAERISWIRRMVGDIRELPTGTFALFHSDARNAAAAESYLRRGLEALMDLGRHILAKGFGYAATEYPKVLHQKQVLTAEAANLMTELAGYRNRMVHFYHEISDEELYEICTQRLNDIENLLAAIVEWINANPQRIDRSL